jgi:hypothetical protein
LTLSVASASPLLHYLTSKMDTVVAHLCEELHVGRATVYRHVSPSRRAAHADKDSQLVDCNTGRDY